MSFVVAAVLGYALSPIILLGDAVPTALVVLYGTAVGVLVDLDHFLIARLKTGRWDAVRFCLRTPSAAVADQGRIFGQGDVGMLSRLLSHLLILGVVVPLLAAVSVPLAILTGAILYVHLVCDVGWDIRRLDHHVDDATDEEDLVRALR
ncbi:hypothetical protein [Halopiger djelfimassiliensis]|uniref:hypothetical protein n=1 Tax=Halopiger djelfimassiliensis TaxID=1293047 RepID=UPI000677781F|nr:hypothetical protein [Halopiger djelfimassiliensis]